MAIYSAPYSLRHPELWVMVRGKGAKIDLVADMNSIALQGLVPVAIIILSNTCTAYCTSQLDK